MESKTALHISSAALLTLLLLPAVAAAQQASGIAGEVRDASGAVLPGVTVEATSPALIERVRTVITNGEGLYSIVDLRPGTYSVTFLLPGFSSVRRDGVELPGAFTATVNAEMRVGAVEETVVVSGAAPLVDTQNVIARNALSTETLEALPSGTKSWQVLVNTVPGMYYRDISANGASGVYNTNNVVFATYHGKRQAWARYDGMGIGLVGIGGTGLGYVPNAFTAEEVAVETGGISAESNTATMSFDMIPKSGGNTFNSLVFGMYANNGLQSNNLNSDLIARGVTTTNQVEYLYDVAGTVGGPIRRDRLWFFGSVRFTGNENTRAGVFPFNRTQGTPFYTEDASRPGFVEENFRSNAVRLTWQISQRNKVNFFGDNQYLCQCRGTSGTATLSPEALARALFEPLGLYQVSWSSPLTNRLLIDGGVSVAIANWPVVRQPEVGPNDISILDQATGLRYGNAAYGLRGPGAKYSRKTSQRFSVSYVTGSHTFKTGIYVEQGFQVLENIVNGDVQYQFRNAVPVLVEQFATPYRETNAQKADLGVYAQDQWRVRRVTLNLGVRFDYFNVYVPDQYSPAGPWVGERRFDSVHRLPEWMNINPRFGALYDLFGDGRTALKASIGRYNGPLGMGIANVASGNNPMTTSVNQVNRTWSDSNGNYVPDCDLRNFQANGECGRISNLNFGQLNPLATRWSEDVLHGWNARDYTWDVSTEVQHQLTAALSVKGGYYRNWFGNFTVTDNLAVTSADFNQYCITAPTTTGNGFSLPGGGGGQICGLADVSPARFGQVTNLVTQAGTYGEQTQVSDFFTLSLNGRIRRDLQLGGGLDTGRTVTDRCFVIDSPQELVNCRVVTPFRGQTQVKLFGIYLLPADFAVSVNFQSNSGPAILATYSATNAQIAPSLGRNLAACGTAAVCTATAAGIPLIVPQTEFEARRNEMDFRVSKSVRLGERLRLQANFDVYNLLNSSGLYAINTAFGSQWRRPTSVQDPRLYELSAQLSF